MMGWKCAAGMLLVAGFALGAGNAPAAGAPKPPSAKKFDALATAALEAMKAKAAELKIGGVAVVNYAPGDTVEAWSSKMAVVGRMKDAPSDKSKGNNLLGIAYAKSAEMADTLLNSGTAKRPPMTGEFGWTGLHVPVRSLRQFGHQRWSTAQWAERERELADAALERALAELDAVHARYAAEAAVEGGAR